jgi:glycosyltransferase involved in cell wall biosynthesis
MQYVDAIIAAGWEMLYITEFGLEDPRSIRLKQTLNDYPKAKVVSVPRNLSGMNKAQFVYDTIMDYAPDKLFMHIHPSAVESVTAFYALPKEITKYQINLTDHTYWVGAGCLNYSFEFREYGASLSVGRRGVPRDRVLLMPYYPMMKATEFAGFPKEAEVKVKIFSGASFYKIMDENDTFFKLNKAILDANPNAVTLFAGGGDMAMLKGLIEKYGIQGRFIPIGQRNDIFECYKHSDIYLSSYPLGGGLMAQFAAHAGLPMLALANPASSGKIEEMVCQKHEEVITFDTMDALVKEASHLIKDEAYRKSRGQAMRECVIGVEEFNRNFQESVMTEKTQYPLAIEENVKLHYLNVEDKLKLENKTKGYQKSIFTTLGMRGIFTCPRIWTDGFVGRIKTSRIGKKIHS